MLELIEVAEIGAETNAGVAGRNQFSLVFHEAGSTYVPQRIYAIKHPTLGWLDIFLVPIGPDQAGMRYQAVFT